MLWSNVMSREENGKVTQALVVRSRECSIGRFRLSVVSGPDRGSERVSDGGEFSIGTAASNQLVLTDRTVSRHHCVIHVTEKGFLLRDVESRNGTTLAGFRIEKAYLGPGAVIGLGDSVVRFEILADEIVEPLADEEQYGRILGQSTAMRRLFAMLPRIAASDSTILIEGETGTGKGLLADVIHRKSPRAKGPFVVIDCSAIPPSLIEAELFGHGKGAFTNAVHARAGAFEAAAGGTVLLDELGELSLDMQPKLLRALEERVIRRIGTLDPVKLDVRILAATNRDLRQEVNRGTFRSDLYYRLNIVRIRLPALRERREDIPLLAAHFYEQFARSGDPRPSEEFVSALVKQDWPGNVRELRGCIERATLMQDSESWFESTLGAGSSTVSALPVKPAPTPQPEPNQYADDLALGSFRAAKERAVAQWERGYIAALVREHQGNLSRAARAAHMDRNHLRELLRRHGISAEDD